MSRLAYVNGRFVPHQQAVISIDDRAVQFADSVYEVVTLFEGRMLDELGHLERLDRSLRALDIAPPMAARALRLQMRQLISRNGLLNGLLYMQVSRGTSPRNHAFPRPAVPASLIMTTKRLDFLKMDKFAKGVDVITTPDQRWQRCDIKTTNLLANCLAKEAATNAQAYEAWMVDGAGYVHEGSSSNAWLITRDGEIITHPANNHILHGITRTRVMALAAAQGYKLVERPFHIDEIAAAKEAFLTSASSFVTPVVRVDGGSVGNGAPGMITQQLLGQYFAFARKEASVTAPMPQPDYVWAL